MDEPGTLIGMSRALFLVFLHLDMLDLAISLDLSPPPNANSWTSRRSAARSSQAAAPRLISASTPRHHDIVDLSRAERQRRIYRASKMSCIQIALVQAVPLQSGVSTTVRRRRLPERRLSRSQSRRTRATMRRTSCAHAALSPPWSPRRP